MFEKAGKFIGKYIYITLIIIFLISFIRSVGKVRRAYERVQKAREEVGRLKEENEKLASQLQFVQSDEFTEKQLRDKLGLVKEGEIIVILPEDEIVRKVAPAREFEEEETLPDPNWKKWVKLFL